jgi:hypothetical protein
VQGKKKLLRTFDEAAAVHLRLLSALNEHMGTMSNDLYLESRREIEIARVRTDQVRQDLGPPRHRASLLENSHPVGCLTRSVGQQSKVIPSEATPNRRYRFDTMRFQIANRSEHIILKGGVIEIRLAGTAGAAETAGIHWTPGRGPDPASSPY